MDTKAVVYKLREMAGEAESLHELKQAVLAFASEIEFGGITQEKWDEAIENARFMLDEYKKIPTGMFGAMNISATIARYDQGERTTELYEELEGIE